MPKNEKQKTLSTDDTATTTSAHQRPSALGKLIKDNRRFLSSILILVLILLAVFSLGSLKKQDTNTTQGSNTPPTSEQATPTIDPAHRFATSCYEFEMPAPHDPIPTDGHCDALGQTYGEKFSSTFSVIPIGKGTTLAELREQWIKSRSDINVSSEAPFKLDGIEATKIIYNATKGDDQKDHAVVIVATPDLKYTNLGQEVRGFVLAGLYDKARVESVNGYDQILATWNWR